MENSPPANPYHPPSGDEPVLAAFAGRQEAFARLEQHLTGPAAGSALLFLGRRHVGKTALLQRFNTFFDDTFMDAFLPLNHAPLNSEPVWLLHVVQNIAKALAARDFTLSRLPEPPESQAAIREWFAETYLAELCSIIRYRRLVLLLDDAEHLADATDGGKLSADHLTYWQELLQRYPQLGMAATLDTAHETRIPSLSPLLNVTDTFRLTNLSPDEGRWLLQQPVRSVYTVSDEMADMLYKAAGGEPHLLQHIGDRLFRRWEASPDHTTITREDVKAVTAQVAADNEPEFRQTWQETTRNERLVLTAITSLLYDDPLKTIDAAAIEGWLVETDYPLDMTAINAALRSLEYREVIGGTQSAVTITAGMMQMWLLENARLSDQPAEVSRQQPLALDWRWVIAAVVVLVLALLLSLSAGRQPGGNAPPLATVTLAGGE